MNNFKDFGIKPTVKGFVGEKIDINRLLNREITVHAFRVEDSKKREGTKCLWLQLAIGEIKYVTFIGATGLIEMIQKVPSDKFPFNTTIIKDNNRLQFS